MEYVIGIIAFVLILGLIILIHEGGHFLMAKRANILCHEFALGMGPIIFKYKKKETLYAIRCIPIGGFVSMAGEEVEADLLKDVKRVRLELNEENHVKTIIFNLDNPAYSDLPIYRVVAYDLIGTKEAKPDELFIKVILDDKPASDNTVSEEVTVEAETEVTTEAVEPTEEAITYIVDRQAMVNYAKKAEMQIAPYNRNFSTKTVGQRFLTVFAGPMMNFILALLLFFIIGLFQGYQNPNSSKIDAVVDSKAPIYGIIDENDEIIEISEASASGQINKITNWGDISNAMSDYASGNLGSGLITIKYIDDTDGVEKETTIMPVTSVYSIELMFKTYSYKDNEAEAKANATLPIVGSYSKNNDKTKSYKAGLRDGDIITSLQIKDQASVPVNTRADVLKFFTSAELEDAKDIIITYTRGTETGKTVEIENYSKGMLASQDIPQTKVQIGISPQYEFNFGKLMYMPWVETGSSVVSIFKTLGLLFTDSSVNVDDFSGPVGIFSLVTSTASSGFLALLGLTAFLSVNIGFVNLLPLPALDGGRLAFIVFEGITKKKPSPKVENIIHTIGFLLLMGLFVFISFNDLLRCFGVK